MVHDSRFLIRARFLITGRIGYCLHTGKSFFHWNWLKFTAASPNPSTFYSIHKTELKFWFRLGIYTPPPLWKWLQHPSVWQPKNRSVFATSTSSVARNLHWGLFWRLQTKSKNLDPDFDCSWLRLRPFFCPNWGDLKKKKKVFIEAKTKFFGLISHISIGGHKSVNR